MDTSLSQIKRLPRRFQTHRRLIKLRLPERRIRTLRLLRSIPFWTNHIWFFPFLAIVISRRNLEPRRRSRLIIQREGLLFILMLRLLPFGIQIRRRIPSILADHRSWGRLCLLFDQTIPLTLVRLNPTTRPDTALLLLKSERLMPHVLAIVIRLFGSATRHRSPRCFR